MPSSSYPVRPPFPISSQVHATEPRDPPSNPVAKADKAVHDASDDLKATGALQRSNQTDDPTSVHNTSETTDEEDIYHRAVTDATTIREANKAESSNGEDSNDSDDPVTPRPTHKEVLQAMAVVERHTIYIDDPFMRELEESLYLLRRQMPALEAQTTKDSKNIRGE